MSVNLHTPKKVILHIINTLELGGSETALYRLLKTMHADYTFFVIVLQKPGYYSALIEQLGIPVHYLNITKTNIPTIFFKLNSLIKQISPDIVQTWLYHADLLGGICAKWCGVKKIIWGVRCEGKNLKLPTHLLKITCALLSRTIPNDIIINSKFAAENHIKIGYPRKKITTIQNGFDASKFNKNKTIARQLGEKTISPESILIGTLARFHPDKDYPLLLQAVDAVCRLHSNVYFVLCGVGCTTTNINLMNLLDVLQYKQRVILINGTENPSIYLNNLDIFILSSLTEAFPNSLAEAMLCELPVIATDVGDVKEMLGRSGLIIPPRHPDKLISSCLNMLSKSQSEREKLGNLARKRVIECYSMEKNIIHMKQIYSRLLSS